MGDTCAKESVVQKKLITRLEEEFPNIYIRKIHQTMYSHKGIPDLLFCLNGRFGGIEVKTAKGTPTKLQIRELTKIVDAGGLAAICAGTKEIENVIHFLKQAPLQSPAFYY